MTIKRKAAAQHWKILKALEQKPMTITELMPVVGLKYEGTAKNVRALYQARHIHVCGHIRTNGNPHSIYALGDKTDAKMVPSKMAKDMGPRRLDAMLQKMVEFLREKPRTAAELGDLLHVCKGQARRYLNHLIKATPRCVYVSGWKPAPGRGNPAPMYALGDKPNAIKPKTTRIARYQKDKRNPERYERILLKQRQLYHEKKQAKNQPASVWAALGI